MLAHELRNPLAPICNAVEVLQIQQAKYPLKTNEFDHHTTWVAA